MRFINGACDVEVNGTDCDVFVDIDGWDSYKDAFNEIELFAQGDNDPMAEPIDDTLSDHGLALVYPGKLVGDSAVSFKVVKLN
jgi:hypothetical protein